MSADLAGWTQQFEAVAMLPWWLHEGDCLWLVEAGAVDVFATGIRDDKPHGTRRPLYRVQPHMAMMPIQRAVTGADQALLAVPLPHSLIRSIPLAELAGFAASGNAGDSVASLVASWIGVITHGLPLPPKDVLALRANEPLALERGQTFCAVEPLVWAQFAGGGAAYMGEDDLQMTPGMPAMPLPRDVWCRALDDHLTVTPVDESALIESGELWHSVTAYEYLAIRFGLRMTERAAAEEATRLTIKAEHSSKVMNEALGRVVRVVRGTGDVPAELASDPLLAACELIGRRINVTFRAPPKRAQAAAGLDALDDIADTSSVRTRAVALKGEWWREDNGPLLAFHAETRAPYALLQKGRQYELHDPATGKTQRVTAALAQTLASFATQFYRPFPPKVIKLFDMFKFAVHGLYRDITAIVALGLLGGLIGMAIPVATGRMVDTIIPSAQHNDAILLMIALIAALMAAQVFEVVRSIAVLRAEGKMDGAVQSAVWDRVLALPVPFFRKYTAGDLANRINGINVIRHALSGTTVGTLLSSVFALLNFFLLFYYSAMLAGVAVVLTMVAMLVVLTTGYLKLRYERQLADLAGHLSGTVYQYLLGIVKLRVAAAENRAFANWAKEFTRYRDIAFKAQNISVFDNTFFAGYSVIINAVIFAVIGMFVLKAAAATGTPPLSTGDFVAFSAAFGAFFGALVTMSETALGLLNLVPIYTRAKPILTSLPEVDAAKKHPGELQGSIEVVKVGFSYTPEQEILKDTTLSVRPGGFIALVGPSGSGKSTLFRLMLGFEKPSRGSIYYDNQDLADLDVRAVRRQFGVVIQGGQLMAGDVFTNIVGSNALTIDDAWEAARMVGLDEDINKMPMGMHTVISEGSSTLSGGQRQRILIARAIVHRPRILFFDEATSALDNRTQAIVSRSLEQLKATRIVIAHRLSTVVNADRIIVLENGAIVQTGNYQDLVDQEGPFADLARRQIA